MGWQAGVFVREQEPTRIFKTIEDSKAERVFLDCLDFATAQGRALSHHKNQPNFAPREMAGMKIAKDESVKARDLESAMKRLFDTGLIEIGAPFKKANRHAASGIVRSQTPPRHAGNGAANEVPV